MMKLKAIRTILSVVTLFATNGIHLKADDLQALSDEFDNPDTLSQWQRVYQTEGWGIDQLEQWDINITQPGSMFMRPHSSTWFQEWRGVQAYKPIEGDFVATTDVTVTRRGGGGAPNAQFSLAGIFTRRPRTEISSPETWTPNGEDYIFLSLGSANTPGTYQFEVKTTQDSNSILEISPAPAGRARIQVARLGSAFIALRQLEGGPWEIHRRYSRPDLPSVLNVGLTSYTDWNTCSQVGFEFHNTHLLTPGLPLPGGGTLAPNPDLDAAFDYFRYSRPVVPELLLGRNFADPGQVSDAQLLTFLGATANLPGGDTTPARITSISTSNESEITLTVAVRPDRSYRLQSTGNLPTPEWIDLTTWISTSTTTTLTDNLTPEETTRFYRVISP